MHRTNMKIVIILLISSLDVHSHFRVAALGNSANSASNMCNLCVFIGTLTAGISVAELYRAHYCTNLNDCE